MYTAELQLKDESLMLAHVRVIEDTTSQYIAVQDYLIARLNSALLFAYSGIRFGLHQQILRIHFVGTFNFGRGPGSCLNGDLQALELVISNPRSILA
jgi:hypothetical protein